MYPLSEDESRRRLATVDVGRLAFTEDALPVIVPVAILVHREDEVVVQAPGSTGRCIANGTIVALEVDDWNAQTREGWSVSAVGPCRLVPAPDATAGLTRPDGAWTDARTGRYLAVRLAWLRGHILSSPSPLVADLRTDGRAG